MNTDNKMSRLTLGEGNYEKFLKIFATYVF
jgi:hypothetical protein